jgi:1-deoxy-D-xylulose-5-phosphate reductoisomerase
MEMIEAREFFGFAPDQIEVLIHPQSLVHALVGFCDGALMAHVGPPDMRHAIGYALNWPQRQALPVEALDLAAIGMLEFRPPDPERYPALRLAREVMQARGLSGAVFNAAKERALDHFIAGRISFTDMNIVVEEVLTALQDAPEARNSEMTLDVVAHMDHLARKQADLVVSQRRTQG